MFWECVEVAGRFNHFWGNLKEFGFFKHVFKNVSINLEMLVIFWKCFEEFGRFDKFLRMSRGMLVFWSFLGNVLRNFDILAFVWNVSRNLEFLVIFWSVSRNLDILVIFGGMSGGILPFSLFFEMLRGI